MDGKIVYLLGIALVLSSLVYGECRTNEPILSFSGTAAAGDDYTIINLSNIIQILKTDNINSTTNSLRWVWNSTSEPNGTLYNSNNAILVVDTPAGKKDYTIDIYDMLHLNTEGYYTPFPVINYDPVDLELSIENFTKLNEYFYICFNWENGSIREDIQQNLSSTESTLELVCDNQNPSSFMLADLDRETKKYDDRGENLPLGNITNCLTIGSSERPLLDLNIISDTGASSHRVLDTSGETKTNYTFYIPNNLSKTYSSTLTLNDYIGYFYNGYLEITSIINNSEQIINRQKWTPASVYYIDDVSLQAGNWYKPRLTGGGYSTSFSLFQQPHFNDSKSIVSRQVYPEVDKGSYQNMLDPILVYHNYTASRIYMFYNSTNVDTAFFRIYINGTLNHSDTLSTDSGLFSYTPPIDDYYYLVSTNLSFTDGTPTISYETIHHYYNNTGVLNQPAFTSYLGYSRDDVVNGMIFVLALVLACIMSFNNFSMGAFLIAGLVSVLTQWGWSNHPSIIVISIWIMALIGKIQQSKEGG